MCYFHICLVEFQVGSIHRLLWSAIERVTRRPKFCEPTYWGGNLPFFSCPARIIMSVCIWYCHTKFPLGVLLNIFLIAKGCFFCDNFAAVLSGSLVHLSLISFYKSNFCCLSWKKETSANNNMGRTLPSIVSSYHKISLIKPVSLTLSFLLQLLLLLKEQRRILLFMKILCKLKT